MKGLRKEQGAAILLVIVTLLLLAVLSHGALVLAMGEGMAAALGRGLLVTRLGAEGVLRAQGAALEVLPPQGEVVTLGQASPGGHGYVSRIHGLAPGFALVEVSQGAREGAGHPRVWARALLRALDPVALAREIRTAVTTPRLLVLPGGSVEMDPSCAGPAPGTTPVHPPPVAEPAVGPFPLEELARLVPGIGPSDTTFVPQLHGAVGAVELVGWSGAGVLAVDGELVIGEGSTFRGIIVAGRLRISAGGAAIGAARVGEFVRVEAGGSIAGSPCVVENATGNIRILLRPQAVPGGWMGPG
jgi:hypothetical protein